MRQRTFILTLFLLGLSLSAYSQAHSVQAGLKGGGNLWLGGSEVQSTIGGNFGVDVSYSCRWSLPKECAIGPKVGVGFSRAGGGVAKDDILENFTNTDYLGHPMEYTISAKAQQKYQQLQVEVPLMLSLQLHRVIVNVGGKFMYVVNGTTNQTISECDITALYAEYNVAVHNEVVTGILGDEQKSYVGTSMLPKIRVLVGAEIGYEWEIGDGSFIGLVGYFDYGVWASQDAGTSTSGARFIDVSPINDPSDPAAQVRAGILQDSYCAAIGYMDFGLKLYYQFESQDRSYYGLHTHHRSRRNSIRK